MFAPFIFISGCPIHYSCVTILGPLKLRKWVQVCVRLYDCAVQCYRLIACADVQSLSALCSMCYVLRRVYSANRCN